MTIFKSKSDPTSSIISGKYKAFSFNPVPDEISQKMIGKSYKNLCPIPIADLAYLQVTHYDMNGKTCLGELIVHKKIANVTMKFSRIFMLLSSP